MNTRVKNFVNYALFDVLFPTFCVHCGKNISNNEYGICKICKSKVDTEVKNYRGEYIFKLEEQIHGKRKWFIDDGVWIFKYEDIIPTLVFSMKFKNNRAIATLFSQYCIETIKTLSWQFDYVTFVPISKDRLWKRGFNQSKIIAKYISKAFNKELHELISIKHDKTAQKKLSSIERFINTYQKFCISNYDLDIKDKTLLIVDDIYTTGATINECARLLKLRGIAKIYVCIVAYAMLKETNLQ